MVDLVIEIFTYDASLDFSIRFPIQEKYYACLFFLIEKCTSSSSLKFSDLPMNKKVSLFTFMFSGLSCGFKILLTLSKQILRNLSLHSGILNAELIQKDS